jgi:ferredoxin-NADP reductase
LAVVDALRCSDWRDFCLVLSDKLLAEDTIAFVFEKPNSFRFKAGQHVRMTLLNPPETDSEGDSRFFSLANAPQENDLVIAMRMRDTAFKRALQRMQTGDKVRIEMLLNSSHEALTLHDDASQPAVFLIGGIGIVPALSMIKDALERKLPHPLFLFYANRRPEDAPFLEELAQLAKQNPSFKLIATMTRPEKSASSWQGETGHIDRSMLEKYVDDLKSPIYYIAGLPEMVSAMKTVLTDSDVSEENIRAEEFTGFIMGQHGSMGQHDVTHIKKGMRPLLIIAIVLLIIAVVNLHAVIPILLAKMGFGAFSLSNPIFSVVIGLLFILAIFKLKHLLGFTRRLSGFIHRKEKQPAREILKG